MKPLFCTLVILLSLVIAVESFAADGAPAKYALLIGCTEYAHLDGKNLRGPKNDAKQLAQALTSRFGFSPDNVRQLVGKQDDANLRPTRDNILRELDQLIAKAGDGVQMVIAFSGHGTRVPLADGADPLDAKNPEPDGYDEAFVAADAQLVDGEMKNLILDNELGERLQALRAKGAHVWAVFDCCHSGTLARGVGDDPSGEVSRELSPADLGIPAAKVKQAESHAAKAGGRKEEPLFDAPADKESRGSLVAFYAAQPFETAPDLPCPANAPRTDEHYFGLLTYSMLQSLLRPKSTGSLTYRELGQAIIGRYRAERGTRGPTPNFAGDLDREVLGLRTFPGRSQILLHKNGTKWSLNAGELQGLSTDSVLAVFSGDKEPLGYVKITRATPTSADVEPCSHEKSAVIAASKLQPAMRCEVVARRMGDMRLKLHVVDATGELAPLVKQVAEKLGDYVDTAAEAAADWQLQTISSEDALKDYQLKLSVPSVLLIRRGESTSPTKTEIQGAGRVWRTYNPAAANFRAELESDLQKIFTWKNLQRVAGADGAELAETNLEVKAELVGADGKPVAKSAVQNGETLELRVTNEGADKVWVTLVFLDADFRVIVVPTQQLNRIGSEGDALPPIKFEVATKTAGPQSWLVIAESAQNLEPDYQFLAQSGLGQGAKPQIVASRASNSPFETLALAVAGQKGAFRGVAAPSAKNPTLLLRSWIATPK